MKRCVPVAVLILLLYSLAVYAAWLPPRPAETLTHLMSRHLSRSGTK